ncbi:MAG: extracellular solute-binding protein [Blautia faecis]
MEYPTTYDELLEVGKVFNENGIIPMAIGSNGGTPSEFFYSELTISMEGGADEIAALASGGNFNTDNAVKVADTLLDMIDNKLFPEDTMANGGWSASLQLYTDGKAAMTYTYPWMYESIPMIFRNAVTLFQSRRCQVQQLIRQQLRQDLLYMDL